MKQQVDLYQKRFRREEILLSALMILRISVALLAGLMLIYGLGRWNASIRADHLDSLRERTAEEGRRVVELEETHPAARQDAVLEAEVQRLTGERDVKARLLRALSSQSLGNTTGFSREMAGLARQRVSGLWLREIRIRRGGRELALVGSALEPDLVPRFIQRLGHEAAFAGSGFQSLLMRRSERDEDHLDFALSTDGEVQP